MKQEQQASKEIIGIMNQCRADESFKQRLLADANATLKAAGVQIPAGITINVLENTDKVIHYILPQNPNTELSDEDLDGIAGGYFDGQTGEWVPTHGKDLDLQKNGVNLVTPT